jgi:predicted AAA+ superfamily ATPase
MIERILEPILRQKCEESKIVVLKGARRTGRLTLVSQIFNLEDPKIGIIDCSNKKERKAMNALHELKGFSQDKKVVIIRDAQLLENLQEYIDFAIELDSLENLLLICSFEPDLHEDLWEALREQGLELNLFPLSYPESAKFHGLVQEDKFLEQRLIYGYYPEVVMNENQSETLISQIIESSIFTQLGASERINKKENLIKLLRHLAFNIGKVISFNDLGKKCGLDNETVERYVKLFAKANLLVLISSYNNGHRYELKKSHVVYFLDNGIRNALIRAFQPLEFRNDVEELWKNFVISERFKANEYAGRKPEVFFWLTHTKQEVDYLEITGGEAFGAKMSWEDSKKIKVPASFSELYPQIKVTGITKKTFWTFLRK